MLLNHVRKMHTYLFQAFNMSKASELNLSFLLKMFMLYSAIYVGCSYYRPLENGMKCKTSM